MLDELEDTLENPENTDSDVEAEVEAIKAEIALRESIANKYAVGLIGLKVDDDITDGTGLCSAKLTAYVFNTFRDKDLPKFLFVFDDTQLASYLNRDYAEVELPFSISDLQASENINEAIKTILKTKGLSEESYSKLLIETMDSRLPLTNKALNDFLGEAIHLIQNV